MDLKNTYHQADIEVADMGNDGRLDVVCRHLGRHRVRVCLQNDDGTWFVRSFDVRDREGMKLADFDRDGVTDMVLNGFWWAGPKSGWRHGDYTELTIDAAFSSAPTKGMNNSTKNGIGDFNGDGRVDVGLVSAFQSGLRPSDNVHFHRRGALEVEAPAIPKPLLSSVEFSVQVRAVPKATRISARRRRITCPVERAYGRR